MSDAVPTKLQGALKSVWTIQVRRGDEEVRVPKFMPTQWIEDGRLDESRLRILKAAGWYLEKLADGQNYLFPNAELASYALGWASDEYVALFPDRAEEAGKARGGGYYDLTDAILYSEALNRETTLPSGAKLFSPSLPDGWQTGASVARNVENALNGGWMMVGLITEQPDLFLLPPEAIAHGAGITLGDAKVGSDTLLALKRDGLISLRGKFARAGGAFSGLNLPPRASRGGEWKLEDMVREQDARWGGEEIKPVVDLARHVWLTRFPELREWLRSHAAYVEEFDLARIRFIIDAWGEIPDIGVLKNIIGGIKGVMGEVAARQEIVKEYRISREPGDVLLVAPQIFDNRMLERSDAIVVNVPAAGDPAIKRVWEVVTDESGMAHAQEQMAASLEAYRTHGVILRRSDGKTIQFKNVTVSGNAGNVQVAQNGGIDRTLAEVREALVMELGLNLVTERVKKKFLPSHDELIKILKEKDGAKSLIELLSAGKEAPEHPVVVGTVGLNKKIKGLRVVSEGEAEKLSIDFFRLGFEGGGQRLVSASGGGSLDLAAAWVSGRINRELDVVEKPYLAGLLGTQTRSQSVETDLTADAVVEHIREHGLTRLLEIAGAVGRTPDWEGNMFVVGIVGLNKKITGLCIVSEEEAGRLSGSFFRLGFEDGGQRLISAFGRGSLDLAAAWVSGRINRDLDVVEKPYLAGLLGTHTHSQSAETDLTSDAVAGHIKEHGLIRLLEVAGAVGRTPDWEGNMVVVGIVGLNKKIKGLRIVSEEVAEKLSTRFFRLGFEGGGQRLVSASRAGSLDLAAAWVSGRINRDLDVVEKPYLAGLLGTQTHSQSVEIKLTADAVAGHIKEHSLTHLLEVAGAVGRTPDWEGNMVVVGQVGLDKKITGLKVVSEEVAENLSTRFFRLGFEDGGKRLVSASGAGSLDLAAVWVSSRIGRELDVVERSYLAGLLGTRTYSQSAETNLTVDAVAGHLREHGLTRLLEIAGAVGRTPDWEGNMVVVGIVGLNKKINGLRIVSKEEAGRLSMSFFRLEFEGDGKNWRLIFASHNGGRSLQEKIEAGTRVGAVRDPVERGSANVNAMTFGGAAIAERAVRLARRLDVAGRSPTGNALRGGITMPIGVAAAQVVERELEGGWRPHDWREELHAVMVAHPSGLAAGLVTGTAGQIAETGAFYLTGRSGAALGTRVAGRLVSPAANLFLMSIFADFVVDGRVDITANEAARSALQMTAVTTATRAPLRAYRAVKAFRHGRRGVALASAAFTDGAGGALGLLLEETAFQVVDLSILATLSWYERQSVRRAFQMELKKEMARFVLMRGGGATFEELRGQAQKILTIAGTWKHFEEETVPFAKLDAEKQIEDSHHDEDSASLQTRLSFIQKKRDEIGDRGLSYTTRWLHPLARRAQVISNDKAPGVSDELKKFESGALEQLERVIRGKIFKASGDKERAEKEYASARRAIQKAFEKRRRPRPSSLAGIRPTRPGTFLDAQNTETIFDGSYPFGLKRMAYELTEDQIIAATPDFSGDPANIFPELERFFLDQSTLAGEELVALNN